MFWGPTDPGGSAVPRRQLRSNLRHRRRVSRRIYLVPASFPFIPLLSSMDTIHRPSDLRVMYNPPLTIVRFVVQQQSVPCACDYRRAVPCEQGKPFMT